MREPETTTPPEVIDLFSRPPRHGMRRRPEPTPYAWVDRPRSSGQPSVTRGFRLRVEVGLRDEPPVWRDLLVRGDISCDRLHRAIGAAFDREGGRRYRLHLGADLRAPRLLRPSEERFVGLAGMMQSDIRLDQLIAREGDELCHVEEQDYDDLIEVSSIRVVEVLDAPTVPVELVDGARLEYQHWREPGRPDALNLGEARVRVRAIDRMESFPWRFQGFLGWAVRGNATAQRMIADLDLDFIEPGADEVASACVPWVAVLRGLSLGAEVDEDKRLPDPVLDPLAQEAGLPPAPVAGLVRTAVAAGLLKIQRRRIQLTRAGEVVVADPSAFVPHLVQRLVLGRARRDRETGWVTVLAVASGVPPTECRASTADLLTELYPPSRFRRTHPDTDPGSPTLGAFEILGGMSIPGHGTPAVAQYVARKALGLP